MFSLSKCKEDPHRLSLGLCTFWVLVYEEPLRNGKLRCFLLQNTFFFACCHCAAFLHTQVLKTCTDLDLAFLYILTWGAHHYVLLISKCLGFFCPGAQRLLPADVLERLTHICYVNITFTLLPTNCFISTTTNSMECLAQTRPLAGVGYFLNIPGFSMQFSLSGISSNLLLWKQNNSSVVMYKFL